MNKSKPISDYEFNLIQGYITEISAYRVEIKDLKEINKRLEHKLKSCIDCEYSANKWTLATIKDIAENIINGNLGSIYGLKKIIDRCNEVMEDE